MTINEQVLDRLGSNPLIRLTTVARCGCRSSLGCRPTAQCRQASRVDFDRLEATVTQSSDQLLSGSSVGTQHQDAMISLDQMAADYPDP